MVPPSEPTSRENDSFAFLALKFLALAIPAVFNVALLFFALVGFVFEGQRYLDWDAEFRALIWMAVAAITGFSLLVLAWVTWLKPPHGPSLLWGTVVNALVPPVIAGAYYALR